MKYVYRNTAIEYLFPKNDYLFSDYGNLSDINSSEIDTIIYFNFLPIEYDIQLLKTWIESYKQSIIKHSELYTDKKIFVIKLENYYYKKMNLSDFLLEESINDFNSTIAHIKNVYPIDIGDFVSSNSVNYKYYYTYNAIINPIKKEEFKKWFCEKLALYTRPAKKCLVLDLDNTLWGGILSEDGIDNLKISGSYPGNAYSDFQKLILNLKNNGVILCIASKNDEKAVIECFNKRDDLVLKLTDFTIRKISWNNKSESILEIAQELNIGLDSIVFIDDSPQERELVKSFCAEVIVPGFPEEPYLLTKFFSTEFEKLFSKTNISEEDKQKTELYEKKLKADAQKSLFKNQDDYIKSLNIEVEYQEVSKYNLVRICELINKTNQFNTTVKRYSFEELCELNKYSMISAVKVKDKFGALGIVGCAIVKTENNTAIIDSFMLSCRVLGRKIEYTYLDIIKKRLQNMGIKKIIGIVVPTKKNVMVQLFYEEYGFKKQSDNKSKIEYCLEI